MSTRTIHIGLPRGSLNTLGRADTESLLLDAGYEVTGYTPGNEDRGRLAITNDPEISAHLVKAQNIPGDIKRGLLDIGITGEDCVEDWPGGSAEFLKLTDLDYGAVEVVFAVPKGYETNTLAELFRSRRGTGEPTIIYTEYVVLTRNYVLNDPGYKELYSDSMPLSEIWGRLDGDNKEVQIIHSAGTTEEYLRQGFPIVDNTQSGRSLERAGGRKLEVIMESTAGLFSRVD